MNKKNGLITLFKSYIEFIRVKDWIHMCGITLLGFLYKNFSPTVFNLFLAFLISSLYLAHGYTLNNCGDRKSDPKEKNPISAGKVNIKTGLCFSYLLFFINLFLTFFFFPHLMIFILLGSMLALIYSFEPFKFKKNFSSGLILNSIGFSFLFIIGYLSTKNIDVEMFFWSFFVGMMILPFQFAHYLTHSYEYPFSRDLKNKKKRFLLIFILSAIPYCFFLSITIFHTLYFGIGCLLFLLIICSIINKEKFTKKNRYQLRRAAMIFGIFLLLNFCLSTFLNH